MTEGDWINIREACRSISETTIQKIEGKYWTVYRVGKIIRIDIKYE